MTKRILTAGGFDNLSSKHIRFLHEASKYGPLEVILYDDALIERMTANAPKFPLPERHYVAENIRYVSRVHTISDFSQIPAVINNDPNCLWLMMTGRECAECQPLAAQHGVEFKVIEDTELDGFPEHDYDLSTTSGKKVIVTGCFDWFHSGHVRFFEEASEYGDLYVILGHDKNLEQLKGPGHPMFPEDERKYMAGSIRFVKQALISTGHGWLDAEPEIIRLKPDGYVVNEDGDKDVKRQYCRDHGIEYIVLRRTPKPGLKRRTSTNLRGF